MGSINFHPFYRNFDEVCTKKSFVSNFSTIKVLEDIYTRNNTEVRKVCMLQVSHTCYTRCPVLPCLQFAETMHEDFSDLFQSSNNEGQASIERSNENSTLAPAPDNEQQGLARDISGSCSTIREPGNGHPEASELASEDHCIMDDSNAPLSISEVQAHRRRVNFIVVGPITDPAKLITGRLWK